MAWGRIFLRVTTPSFCNFSTAACARARSARVRAWLDRMEDLSGVEPANGDWFTYEQATESLKPLLTEIGRVYLPFLKANAAAVVAGKPDFETEIDGQVWKQPTFPYQAKCLQYLRDAASALPDGVRTEVRQVLSGTGCEELLN